MPIKPPFQLARCQIIHPPSPSLFNLSQIMQAEHGEAKDRKQAFWRTHTERQTGGQGRRGVLRRLEAEYCERLLSKLLRRGLKYFKYNI